MPVLLRLVIGVLMAGGSALAAIAFPPEPTVRWFIFWIAWLLICSVAIYRLVRNRPLFPK
jgi:hypothetical protein